MGCKVCESQYRAQIEQALLNMDPTDDTRNLAAISQQFKIPENDLKLHVLFHCQLGINSSDFVEAPTSIAREAKYKEVAMLEQVAQEYLVTLKTVGARINSLASGRADELYLEKYLTKAVADLYINAGAEIRKTVEAMTEVHQLLNGTPDGGMSGLAALAAAISGSKNGGSEK